MKEGHLLSTAGVPRSEMRKTRDNLKKSSAQNLRSLKTGVIQNLSASVLFIISFPGLDEDLADAKNEDFFISYKTWKEDHYRDTINQKVSG